MTTFVVLRGLTRQRANETPIRVQVEHIISYEPAADGAYVLLNGCGALTVQNSPANIDELIKKALAEDRCAAEYDRRVGSDYFDCVTANGGAEPVRK